MYLDLKPDIVINLCCDPASLEPATSRTTSQPFTIELKVKGSTLLASLHSSSFSLEERGSPRSHRLPPQVVYHVPNTAAQPHKSLSCWPSTWQAQHRTTSGHQSIAHIFVANVVNLCCDPVSLNTATSPTTSQRFTIELKV